jgi:hypothetical protein
MLEEPPLRKEIKGLIVHNIRNKTNHQILILIIDGYNLTIINAINTAAP